MGMVGGVLILLTYGYLVRWGTKVASHSPSVFGRLAAAGLAFTLFLYVSINIAMVMGLAPVVGIPLPLLSYGGSAMMTVLILLGILMSINREKRAVAGF
jgi:rod shape determining protein RodA